VLLRRSSLHYSRCRILKDSNTVYLQGCGGGDLMDAALEITVEGMDLISRDNCVWLCVSSTEIG
jgi:hypothetical protein